MKKWRLWIGPELCWCEETDEPGRYKLLNTPAFDKRYGWGDIVSAIETEHKDVLVLAGEAAPIYTASVEGN